MSIASLLVINSKDRASGVAENFTYNFQFAGLSKVRNFRINKISIPFSWFPVVAQTFRVSWNGTAFTIPVTAGMPTGS